jgi:autotransporter translocation and assembly factor TamB
MLQRRASPATNYLRRTLQVVALVGTLLVGIVAFALIVSQTPWFRDWLRKVAIKESKLFLNGDLSIGRLEGNVFYGVQLKDIAIDVNGEHIVSVKQIDLAYSLPELLSKGIVIPTIRLDEPFVVARHDANGWNLAGLVKRQQQEADREGPRRSVSLPHIEIANGRASIDDRAPSDAYRFPSQVENINLNAGFLYEPVHYSLTLDQFSFVGKAPDLTLSKLTGRLGVRDENLHVESLALQTRDSSVTIDGVIRGYLSHPSLQVTVTTPRLSLPEFAPVVPVLRGYDLHPSLNLRAGGPQEALDLTLDSKSEAGAIAGKLNADLEAPDLRARGTLEMSSLNLAPILRSADQKSDITGRGTVDLRLATSPENMPVMDRLRATYVFQGPRVVAAGYRADKVTAKGTIEGRHISFDGRANAYGGSATVKGFIETPAKGPLRFDIAGTAAHLDMRNLPAAVNAPRLATDLNASAYHVKGRAGELEATATLDQSTLEGATIGTGTTTEFGLAGKDIRYAARGSVRNLDLSRIGTAFHIDALAKPNYESAINGEFDAHGQGTTLADITLDTTATLSDSRVLGGVVPRLAVDVHLDAGSLRWKANGEFREFDPSRVTGKDALKGTVTGTVDASFAIQDLSAPITPDSISADGRVTLTDSELAGVKLNAADIDGQYAERRGTLRQATVKGPDIEVEASGPIALDTTGSTNVKYHVVTTDIAPIGNRFDQQVSGSATVDGTITGNATSLQTTGTVNGSNLGYQSNNALDTNSAFTVTLPDLDANRVRVQARTDATFLQLGGLHINEVRAETTYAEQKLDFQAHAAQGPENAAEAAVSPQGSDVRELDAGGTVIFHPDHQEIHLPRFAIRTQGVEWTMAPGGDAAVQYSKDRIDLQNVRLVNGNQSLDLSGSLSVGDGVKAPSAITVRAAKVDLAQIDKLLLQGRGFTGTLNAEARITGDLKSPAIDGHAEVMSGGFQRFTYQSLTVTANYAPAEAGTSRSERIVLDAKLTQSPGAELRVSGTVPMTALRRNPPGVTGHIEARPGDELDVHVQSSLINLGIVQGFTNQLTNVTGTLQADVRVTGSGEDPHLTGSVDIRDGGFTVPAAKTSFTGLATKIDLQQDVIRIPQFQILDQHGKPLTISGELAVHQGQAGAVNIAMESDDFKLMDNELGNIHVGSHLKITGEMRRPRIEGDLRTDAGRLEIDKILQVVSSPYSEEELPDVVTAQPTSETTQGADAAISKALERGRESARNAEEEKQAGATVEPTSGAFSALALNVHLVAPNNLVVRGQGLRPGGPTRAQIGNVNTTVGVDLQVQKEPDAPLTLRGKIETVRGFYEFQGRRFEIVRGGSVQFPGLPVINPQLDITAQRLIPNTGVTATIHVTGTMRSPELGLTSVPPLDEADILALIIFNRSVNDLGTGERASLAETAGGIASGFIASPLSRSIGKALDVDLFEITTSDPQTGETAGGVTLGKQVSDKAFVRFRQQFGQRSFTEFMLEYQLATFLRLETSLAPETAAAANRLTQRRVERAGVDLIFFFSY